jgi:3D-(3,5/4)-trihydroxycyclohexane-1,2-dione acylhydrolase (decyclizing)
LQRSVGVPSFINERRARAPGSGRLDGPVVAVDFAAHAAAMGARTWSVHDLEGLQGALTEARAAGGVRVIVVATDPERRVPGFDGWWDVPPAEVSERTEVRAARAAHQTAAARRRSHAVVATPPPALDSEEER